MDERLTISTSTDGGTTTLKVAGDLDPSSSSVLDEAVTTALARDGVEEVVVDAAAITFVDSSGLSALVNGHADATDAGVRFVVDNPTPLCVRLFEATGLTELLLRPAAT
jgi:anti-sigma B factor antagonist